MSHDHHPSAPASPDDAYYSAYRGSVNAPDGSFDHFLRIVYPIHEQKGYWRFHSIEDERRAFVLGLSTPEMVLLAVDRGDGPFDEIVLRWLPGSLDKGNKPSIGTAAAHLQSICNERRILGRPLSFLGRVPTYPIITDSTDPILLNFRLVKYGLEKGDPHVVGIVKTHQQHTRPQDGVVMSIEEQNGSTGQQTRSGASRGISAVADTDQDLSMPLDPDLFDSPTARLGPQQLSFPYTNQHRTCSEASRTSTRTSIQSSPGVELAPFEDVIMIAESPEQEQEFVEFSKMNNQLPCIDCDQVGSHSWDCNIGSIKPLKHLTPSDHEELADAVTRFDPQPWTTHAGPPKQPERLDLATRTREMAQTIRLLDSYTDDNELYALPDKVLMFMWALKVTPGVDIVQN